jgi:TetR/AcrR family transcriptional repressor of nem operon
MPRASDKRERLLDAAKELIYQQGFNQTTLADIARESDVPLGNVYYYFKTKEEIGAAVIQARTEEFAHCLKEWEENLDPQNRLIAFLDMMRGHAELLANHGCPVGSLCQELHKEHTPLTEKADRLLKLQIDWAARQFRLMGHEDAEALAGQYVATMQGIVVLATALGDADVVYVQTERMKTWLSSL